MKDIKALIIRVPKPMWIYLKKKSIEKEMSMNEIIMAAIEKMKKNEK